MSDFFTRFCPHCHNLITVATEAQQIALQLLCLDIDRQRDWPEGSGHHIGSEKWKQLLLLAWERAHDGEDGEILPSIDGAGFDIVYRRPERLAKVEMSELLAFADAWCAERGIVRSRSRRELREEPF